MIQHLSKGLLEELMLHSARLTLSYTIVSTFRDFRYASVLGTILKKTLTQKKSILTVAFG